MNRIESAIRDYIIRRREGSKNELEWFAAQNTLREAINQAALGIYPQGKRHPHQRRLSNIGLQRSTIRLLAISNEIQDCSTFDELHSLIGETVGTIRGIGELYCYDTALRIGAYLSLHPQKVYLHRGTRDGAELLGIDGKRKTVGIEELPEAFWSLEPHEAEDVLCIYKRLFK